MIKQWKTLYIKHSSKTTRWLKLTRQDKTGTQVIEFIHWIKDQHLGSVHWNFKFMEHIHAWTRVFLGSCGMFHVFEAHEVPMAAHSTVVHPVFVWLVHRICWMISSLPVSICQLMISRSYVVGKQDITLSCMLVLREYVVTYVWLSAL